MSITRFLVPGKTINRAKLQSELNLASIPAESVGANEATNPGELRIDFLDSSTLAQRTTETDAVITAHSSTVGPLQTWAQLHLDRILILAKAAKLLDDGINGHTLAGANDTTRTTALRTCIGNSATMLRTDSILNTHLDKLVDLMAFPSPASATLAQCRNMLVSLQAFIAIHGAMAGIALSVLE